MTIGVVACGALSGHVVDIVDRHNLDVTVEAIEPLFHNTPTEIPPAVEDAIKRLQETCDKIAIAYADCGTYGELDSVCEYYDVERLQGDTCYDVFATVERMKSEFETTPGTYVLTDFLVRTFKRSVIQELGLDRYPHLRDDYFHAYTRMLWIAQHPTPELERLADEAASLVDLPLEIVRVGDQHLEEQLLALIKES